MAGETLEELQAKASEMSEMLTRIRAVLTEFDWEYGDRQYALEKIDDILGGTFSPARGD